MKIGRRDLVGDGSGFFGGLRNSGVLVEGTEGLSNGSETPEFSVRFLPDRPSHASKTSTHLPRGQWVVLPLTRRSGFGPQFPPQIQVVSFIPSTRVSP